MSSRVRSRAGAWRHVGGRSFKRASLIGLAFACWLVAQPLFAAERGLAVRFDPDKPDRKTAPLWLAYLIARATHHDEQKLATPRAGEIVPTFAEEVYGRRAAIQVYRELKAKDATIRDPYWETMATVEAAGMLEPYVWSYHKRGAWAESARPKTLPAFEAWRRTNLKQHRPQTFGSLEAKNR